MLGWWIFIRSHISRCSNFECKTRQGFNTITSTTWLYSGLLYLVLLCMLTFRSADCWLRWGRIVLTMALSFTLIACILLNQILVRINVVLLLPWNCPTFYGLLLNSKIVQLFVSPERSTSIASFPAVIGLFSSIALISSTIYSCTC